MKQETGRLKEILHVLTLCSHKSAFPPHVNAFGYIAREVLS